MVCQQMYSPNDSMLSTQENTRSWDLVTSLLHLIYPLNSFYRIVLGGSILSRAVSRTSYSLDLTNWHQEMIYMVSTNVESDVWHVKM